MNLKDILEETKASKQRTKCTVGSIMTELSKDDIQSLTDALNDPNVSSAIIATALNKAGHKVGRDSIGNHRRGICRCR